MIREVEGDILLSKAQVIAHGIAPQDHFDSGLALSLRERRPSMVRDYRHAAHAAPEPGGIWVWSGVDADGGIAASPIC
jgi:O-acetyl-ADP-ribose deacetylase (regulator of RNase III)